MSGFGEIGPMDRGACGRFLLAAGERFFAASTGCIERPETGSIAGYRGRRV